MKSVTITLTKSQVYDEVAKTTAYGGAKMLEDDPNAYKRMFTTKADRDMLSRFWDESCVSLCQTLRRYLTSESQSAESSVFNLELSESYDEALTPSLKKEFLSFFVMNIVSMWYTFTNKAEAADYSTSAAGLLEGIHRKVCYKKKPKRPTY